MTVDRDPVVGGVLDLLPDPPVGDRFWTDLSARLRTERPNPVLGPVAPLPPEEAQDLARRSPGRRPDPQTARRRRIVGGLVAAAVAAGAVLLVGALQDDPDRDDVRVGPLDPTSTTAAPTSTDDASAPTGDPEAAQAVIGVVQDWIAAIDGGDVDQVWATLGPQSRELGFEQVEALMRSDLREGWGAWSQAGAELSAAEVTPTGNPTVWAVTLRGVIAQEGPPEYTSAVLLVTEQSGGLLVEPFLPGTAIGLIEEPLGSIGAPPFAAGEVLPIAVDADASGHLVAVDGVPVPDDALVRDEAGTIRGARVPDLAAGEHTLTVAMVTADDVLAADAKTFTVR